MPIALPAPVPLAPARTDPGRRRLRADAALVLLAALAVVVPLARVPAAGDTVVLPRLALTVAAAGLALLTLASRRDSPLRWSAIRWPLAFLAAFMVHAAAATFANPHPTGALLGEYQRYQGLVPLLMYGALALATAAAVRDTTSLRALCWAITAGGVVAAAAGAASVTGLTLGGWVVETPTRAGGLYLQPNTLGVHLCVGATLGAGLAVASRGWPAALAALGAGFQAAVLVATLSRGAWLGVLAALAILSVFALRPSWRRLRPALAAGLVAAALVVAVPGARHEATQAWHRARAGADLSNQSLRLGLWRMAVDMTRDEPVIGSGPDSFSVRFPAYRQPDQPGIGERNVRPESSHNAILDQFVAFGVTGGALFLALHAACAVAGLRAARHLTPDARRVVVAVVAAHAGYLAATFFGFTEAMTGWLPWLLVGAELGIAAAASPRRAPPPPVRRLRSVVGRSVLAVAGLLLLSGAVVALAADVEAGSARAARRRGDFAAAARHLRRAERLNPLVPGYALDLAAAHQSTFRRNADPAALDQAAGAYHRANARFAPTGYSLLAEADVLFTRAAPGDRDAAFALVQRARALDPYNAPMRAAATGLLARER